MKLQCRVATNVRIRNAFILGVIVQAIPTFFIFLYQHYSFARDIESAKMLARLEGENTASLRYGGTYYKSTDDTEITDAYFSGTVAKFNPPIRIKAHVWYLFRVDHDTSTVEAFEKLGEAVAVPR